MNYHTELFMRHSRTTSLAIYFVGCIIFHEIFCFAVPQFSAIYPELKIMFPKDDVFGYLISFRPCFMLNLRHMNGQYITEIDQISAWFIHSYNL